MNTSTYIGGEEQPRKDYVNDEGQNQQQQGGCLDPITINQLYEARDRLKNFSVLISQKSQTPIREDVLSHCDKLKDLRNENFCYEKIEKIVKNRIQKIIKNKRIKKNWGREDISILVWVISKYADYTRTRNVEKDLTMNNWSQISLLIPGVKPEACMFKWLSLKRNKLADNSWSEKESLLLDRLVRKHEEDWGLISEELYFMNRSANKVFRCPKQCREHWNCYLNPKLKKGIWEPHEDFILLTEVRKRGGQKKWTELSKFLNGRTQNALKNRYNLIIDKQKGSRKQIKITNIQQQLQLVDAYLTKHHSQLLAQSMKMNEQKMDVSASLINQVKIEEASVELGNQRPAEKRQLRKRKVRVKISDSENEESSLNRSEKVQNNGFSTPKIFENHIIQLNSLDCSPLVFNSCYPKLISEQQFVSESRLINDFHDQARKQVFEVEKAFEFENRENDQLAVDIKKLQIISISENNMGMFTELVKNGENNGCSFVPCKINSQNKLTKFTY